MLNEQFTTLAMCEQKFVIGFMYQFAEFLTPLVLYWFKEKTGKV